MKKIKKSNIIILIILIMFTIIALRAFTKSRASKTLEVSVNFKDNASLLSEEVSVLTAINEGEAGVAITLPEFINTKKVCKYIVTKKEVIQTEENDTNSIENTLDENSDNTTNTEETKMEILPNEKIYLTQEEIDNLQMELVVEYDYIEINSQNLYKKELVVNDDNGNEILSVLGYMPNDVQIKVEEIDITNLESEILEKYPNRNIIGNYNIKLIANEKEYIPKEYEQILDIKITNSEENINILEIENNNITELKDIIINDGKIELKKDELKPFLILKQNNINSNITNDINSEEMIPNNEIEVLDVNGENTTLNIDDYESDKNYYLGLNYTEENSKTYTGKYTENNLKEVIINYYSYNYDLADEITEDGDIPYGTISDTEIQTLLSYRKCVPVNDNGNISIELIDNPFMNRPEEKGFNGWVTNDSRYRNSISTNENTFVQTLTTNINNIEDNSGKYIINLYVDWIDANVIFVSSSGSSYNTGTSPDRPVNNDWNNISTKINSNRKRCTNASDREVNIVVLMEGTLSANNLTRPSTPYTLTSLYNGINYGGTDTYLNVGNTNIQLDSDLQINHLYVNTSVSYLSSNRTTDGTAALSPCIYGNMYNLRLGRGIIPVNSNNCTWAQVQGGYYNHNSNEYKLVMETGKYLTAQLYRAAYASNDTTSNATWVMGNDIDRNSNNNESLKIYDRIASKTTSATCYPYTGSDSRAIVVYMNIKSGTFGIDYFNNASTSDSSDRNYTGIYVGGHGQTGYDKSDRYLIVEGGNIANIIEYLSDLSYPV